MRGGWGSNKPGFTLLHRLDPVRRRFTAHEFRNPLQTISLAGHLLVKTLHASQPGISPQGSHPPALPSPASLGAATRSRDATPRNGVATAAKMLRYASTIERASEDATKLLDQIVLLQCVQARAAAGVRAFLSENPHHFSSLESGAHKLDIGEAKLDAIVGELRQHSLVERVTQERTFQLSADATMPAVRCDRARLMYDAPCSRLSLVITRPWRHTRSQLVLLLIENALESTTRRGAVKLAIHAMVGAAATKQLPRAGHHSAPPPSARAAAAAAVAPAAATCTVVIMVSDDGLGLESGAQHDIFAGFGKVRPARQATGAPGRLRSLACAMAAAPPRASSGRGRLGSSSICQHPIR